MKLRERIQKYGLAGLFAVTGVLSDQLAARDEEIRLLKQVHREALGERELGSNAWESRFDNERQRAADERQRLMDEQAVLIRHLAGVTEAASVAEVAGDPLEKLWQEAVVDPYSQAVREGEQEAQEEIRRRMEARFAQVQHEEDDMAAVAVGGFA